MEFLKCSWFQQQQLMGVRCWAMYTPSVYFGSQHIHISLGAEESPWKHAGYHCLGCTQILLPGQHTGSPYMRGTKRVVQDDPAELRNVPSAAAPISTSERGVGTGVAHL